MNQVVFYLYMQCLFSFCFEFFPYERGARGLEEKNLIILNYMITQWISCIALE